MQRQFSQVVTPARPSSHESATPAGESAYGDVSVIEISPVAHLPRVVRNAVEFIDEKAAEPIVVADIASACLVSPRTLQTAFARHLQRSPMSYVREVRLRRAHRELLAADPAVTSVADVARHWGYVHLGRFASNYRSVFGQLPSHTLRSAP